MSEDKPKKTRRRVNYKRKALNTVRKKKPKTRLLTVCLDTDRNLWKALVFDTNTKRIVCSGKIKEGQIDAHRSLNEEIDKAIENM